MRAPPPRIPKALHLSFHLWASLRFTVCGPCWALWALLGLSRFLDRLGLSGHLRASLVLAVPLWASLGLPGPLCASLGLFEPLSPSLDPSGVLWASTELWISLGLAGILWTLLDLWGSLDLSGPVWESLGRISASLGLSGSPWVSLEFCGTLCMSLSGPL